MYEGIYHGKKAHDSDLEHVIQRAQAVGCKKLMVTGSNLDESKRALQLAKDYRKSCIEVKKSRKA